MATGILRQVGKHGRQRLAADGVGVAVVAAQGRELGHCLQQTAIGILGCTQREEIVELALAQHPFDPFDVVRIVSSARLHRFHYQIVTGDNRGLDRSHGREVGQRQLFGIQLGLAHINSDSAAIRRSGLVTAACVWRSHAPLDNKLPRGIPLVGGHHARSLARIGPPPGLENLAVVVDLATARIGFVDVIRPCSPQMVTQHHVGQQKGDTSFFHYGCSLARVLSTKKGVIRPPAIIVAWT